MRLSVVDTDGDIIFSKVTTEPFAPGAAVVDYISFEIEEGELPIQSFSLIEEFDYTVDQPQDRDIFSIDNLTLVNNQLEGPGVEDLDGDGFVDGITNYQMWTESGGVDLTNRRGKTFSDDTSRLWDLTKAVEVDGGFMILLEGDRSKEGKYRVVNARDTGVISGATPWATGRKLAKFGYEEIFDMDFNGNDVVDVV